MSQEAASPDAAALLTRLRAFCFPSGEPPARGVRAIKTTQRGEFRAAPGARWMPFTADEIVEAAHSSFRWEARFGSGIRTMVITDAYEQGRGRLTVKLGGVVPVKNSTGPDFDKGELQRYLASFMPVRPCC